MSGPPTKRRRTKAIGPDSTLFSIASTHKTVRTTNRAGEIVEREILVPLIPLKSSTNDSGESSRDYISTDNNNPDYGEDLGSYNVDDNLSARNKSHHVCLYILFSIIKSRN